MFERLLPNTTAVFYANDKQQDSIASSMGFQTDITTKIIEQVVLSKIETGGASHKIHYLNIAGYMPIISTFTGAYRALVGTAYLIKSLACVIFDAANRRQHCEGIKIAVASIGRGLLEMAFIIGNIITFNIDAARMMHRWAYISKKNYGDLVPQIEPVDNLGAVPLLGTVINLARTIFFSFHLLVNVPGILCNRTFRQASLFSAKQIAIGILGIIPIVGTVSYIIRDRCC